MRTCWFEQNLKILLMEAGKKGLRVCDITRNVCNMEPSLFGSAHSYEETWWEIYQFLRSEDAKPQSPYKYVVDKKSGKKKRGWFYYDKNKEPQAQQTTISF